MDLSGFQCHEQNNYYVAGGAWDCSGTVKSANTTDFELLYLHDYLELEVKQGMSWDLRLGPRSCRFLVQKMSKMVIFKSSNSTQKNAPEWHCLQPQDISGGQLPIFGLNFDFFDANGFFENLMFGPRGGSLFVKSLKT